MRWIHRVDERAPSGTLPVGYAALVELLTLNLPVRRPACVASRHVAGSRRTVGGWTVFDKRYAPAPGDGVFGHLAFALKHECVDLLLLRRSLAALPGGDLEAWIASKPRGSLTRRAWFFHEWFGLGELGLPDVSGAAVDALDPSVHVTGAPRLSRRHRVRDNLPGVPGFCPTIRRTTELDEFSTRDLAGQARDVVGRTSAALVARAASFLLLADSRATFEIEGERAPRDRLERWARALQDAGRRPFDLEELERLHRILIADDRFILPGLRCDGVFLGEHDSLGMPLPEFIGARAEDLPELCEGLIAADARMGTDRVDAVLHAAGVAFGFVYVHPLQDGNGRLHRWLIHHVLARRDFSPPGVILPISSAMLDAIDGYREVLQAHSSPLMSAIEWHATPDGNVRVGNDTIDLYRYPDVTDAAVLLYRCIRQAIDVDLPREIDFLRRHDEAMRRVMERVELPDRMARLFILFTCQEGGRLPNRRRRKEFEALEDDELADLEAIVVDTFELDDSTPGEPGARR